jgi:hypothetical protein
LFTQKYSTAEMNCVGTISFSLSGQRFKRIPKSAVDFTTDAAYLHRLAAVTCLPVSQNMTSPALARRRSCPRRGRRADRAFRGCDFSPETRADILCGPARTLVAGCADARDEALRRHSSRKHRLVYLCCLAHRPFRTTHTDLEPCSGILC